MRFEIRINGEAFTWRAKNWLYLLILLACIWRGYIAFETAPTQTLSSDMRRIWNDSLHFFTEDKTPIAVRDAPLHHLALFLVRFISLDDEFLISCYFAVFSLVLPLVIYKCGREWGLGKELALRLYFLASIMPSWACIYSYNLMVVTLLPILVFALYLSGRALRKCDMSSWFWALFVWFLACSAKAQAFVPAFLTLGYCFWKIWLSQARRGQAVKVFLASVLFFVLLSIPNAIRTSKVLGYAAPFGSGLLTRVETVANASVIRVNFLANSRLAKNLKYNFSSPAQSKILWPFSDYVISRKRFGKEYVLNVDTENGREDYMRALAEIPNSWSDKTRRWGENFLLFFFHPSWPDATDFEGNGAHWRALNYWLRWPLALVMLIAIVGNIWRILRGEFHFFYFLSVLMVVTFILQSYAIVEGRYRKPIELLLIMSLFFWGKVFGKGFWERRGKR